MLSAVFRAGGSAITRLRALAIARIGAESEQRDLAGPTQTVANGERRSRRYDNSALLSLSLLGVRAPLAHSSFRIGLAAGAAEDARLAEELKSAQKQMALMADDVKIFKVRSSLLAGVCVERCV